MLNLINVLHNFLYLAKCEINEVVDLDVQILYENKHKLTMIYSTIDQWIPL